MVLREECYFFVNESNLMEQNVKTLEAPCKVLLAQHQSQKSLSWIHNPLFSWLLCFIGPLIMLCFILMLAPCFIQFLWPQITTITKLISNEVMIHYHALEPSEMGNRFHRAYNDTSPL